MTHTLRQRTLAAAIAAVFCLPMIAHAQDTATAPDSKNAKQLQAVQVLGSRIRGAEIATQTPTTVITAQQIAQTGLTSLGDILQQLSQSGSALNTKFNSAGNFGFPPDGSGVGSGSATLSLRNLGAKRTLILVDGLRWVNESSASGVSAAVDLNTIPVSIIERIEILPDGASALYGSDAVGGVVNIITKRTQNGAAVSYYVGGYDKLSGGMTSTGSASLGGKFDRGEFFIDYEHVNQNAISSGAWSQSGAACVPGTGLANCSSATPTGRFIFIDPQNNTQDVTLNGSYPNGAVYPTDFHNFTTADRFNFAPYNLLLTPNKRDAVFASTRYQLTDDITWYVRGLYVQRNSKNQAAPEPIFLGPGAGTGGLADTVGVDVTNPYNPFGYTLNPDPVNGNLILIGRRPIEGGPRIFSQIVNTWEFATGLTGSFSWNDRDYYWDVNYSRGSNSATQTVQGTYNIAHIQRALGPVSQCTGNCVPLNLFGGPGTITPAMLAYIGYIEHDNSGNDIELYSANLNGPLFALPAGDVKFATGVESRRYSGYYQPDAVVVAGESNGVPSLPTSGAYNVNEFYLEANAPLLANQPFVEALNIDLASRYSNYSTFGGTTNSQAGLRWQVDKQLTLRGTWGQGFRAPAIGELYGSPARFDATLQDPCSAPIANPTTAANCAALGVPASYSQPNPQISVTTGGNRLLQPEKARTLTWGGIYSPDWAVGTGWAQRLDITADYYRVTVRNAIQALDAQTQLDDCVASGNAGSLFCQGIHRNATGNIDGFNNTLRNIGRIDTSGADLTVKWVLPEFSFGRLSNTFGTTYVGTFSEQTSPGVYGPRKPGVEVNDSGIPRWRAINDLMWSRGAWSADWRMRYMSGLTEDCAGATGFPICNGPNNTHYLGAVTYHDVRVSWRVPLALDLVVNAGINNLFGKEPPVCLSCSLNGYDASNYDLPGRFSYVQATLKF
ncbi:MULTISPECIES: TonB-dependent receptor [Metallibacterium]|jgi:iron complex outermembrane receptor protein|uniref:TonB-dependent receptor n=1 Tax=Metallibacterium TaxID=1218803 RepID=UPI002618476D|nr:MULTISPECIES: TonB-dependent receptor [Metallibacterium]MBW8074585.1 TonB-dependent receptor [Metallibacterium scheffleri]